jgi:hypothetical protein
MIKLFTSTLTAFLISSFLFSLYCALVTSLASDCFLLTSVLRVWDVLLYEGNRVMLFRTALALMELYGTEELR